MKKHKENLFAHKFRLLSSQESTDINWSSSDSSDFENVSRKSEQLCSFTKKINRKRKRKQTAQKNISNLDITVIDAKDTVNISKSGISVKTEVKDETRSKSPILHCSQYFSPYKPKNVSTSPILTCKTTNMSSDIKKTVTSPILVLKTASPNISPHVRKKLFKSDVRSHADSKIDNCDLILNGNHCLDRRKSILIDQTYEIHNKSLTDFSRHVNIKDCNENQQVISHCKIKTENEDPNMDGPRNFIIEKSNKYRKPIKIIQELQIDKEISDFDDVIITDSTQQLKETKPYIIDETPELNVNDSMAMLKTSSRELASKVKNYFDSHFSSDNPSQQTISEVATPRNSSKTSDDVEIITIPTQVLTNRNTSESVIEIDNVDDKKEKKIRYKKDGLAYRLNNLLKKQTASISLWQHERYLANNSNFVLPKEEFLALRVYKVNFKYGCYSLEAMDLNDESYVVLINKLYAKETILSDCIMKLYEPYYNIVDFSCNCKMIINVSKFEFVTIKN